MNTQPRQIEFPLAFKAVEPTASSISVTTETAAPHSALRRRQFNSILQAAIQAAQWLYPIRRRCDLIYTASRIERAVKHAHKLLRMQAAIGSGRWAYVATEVPHKGLTGLVWLRQLNDGTYEVAGGGTANRERVRVRQGPTTGLTTGVAGAADIGC